MVFLYCGQPRGKQHIQLFLNDGNGSLSISSAGDLSSDGGCSYSSSFADYDNDGDLYLFVGNGFCNGQRESRVLIDNPDRSWLQTVEVYDLNGRRWVELELDLHVASHAVALPVLPAGMYFVRVGGAGNAVAKFVQP